jgi:ribosomal protein L11 methyltransferase
LRRLAGLGVDPSRFSCAVERVDDGRWVERYQESLRAFPIGERFTVHPRGRIEADDGREPLLLVPGRAFGTGEHATTQLCTEYLERVVRAGERWLDVGCGSGILLLVARVLGAEACVGIEIDPDAVRVACDVLARNGATGCELLEGGLERAEAGIWDGVLCNISTTFVRMHVAELAALPRPAGRLVVSGVLREDVPELVPRFADRGWSVSDRQSRGPWGLIAFTASA